MLYGLFVYYDEDGYSDGLDSQFELFVYDSIDLAVEQLKVFVNEWLDKIEDKSINRAAAISAAVSSHEFDCYKYADWIYNHARIKELLPGHIY